jgi:hypothetical protein
MLYLGTTGAGSTNLYNSGATNATSETVSNLPQDGLTVYARIHWLTGSTWQYADYTFTEAGSPVPASLTSPAPRTTLTGSSATFSWTAGAGPTAYMLYLGTTGVGSRNLYNSGSTTATSETVSALPTSGLTLYARLHWLMGSTWQYADYTYTEAGTPTPPSLTSPSPGTTLTGSSATFSWTAGTGPSAYMLYLGTAGLGSTNLYNSGATKATSETLTTLPKNGLTLYARLHWLIGSTWHYADYTYTETGSPTPASLTSPAPGTKLTGSSATFSWTAGAGPTAYMLYLGTTGAGSMNLYNSGSTAVRSETISGLPENGTTLYARLHWLMGSTWQYADYVFTEANLTPSLNSLSCTNSSMTGAGTDACTVALSAAAGSGGLTIGLASNNSSVTVPASVQVSAGATSTSFSATISSVSSTQTATLTASAGSVVKSFTLELNAAVPTLSINATSVAFGDVTVNMPATQSVTLTSTGGAPVTVSSATITGTGFSFSGASFPMTLNSNQTTMISVEFDPTTAGVATGQLTISSNSSTNSTAQISLTGTGEAAAYSVSLTWQAPGSSPDPVASYNVYRSPSGGSSYQLLGSVSNSQLAYTDGNNIQDGQVYDYIVESVDSSGNESVPSNTASVTIP